MKRSSWLSHATLVSALSCSMLPACDREEAETAPAASAGRAANAKASAKADDPAGTKASAKADDPAGTKASARADDPAGTETSAAGTKAAPSDDPVAVAGDDGSPAADGPGSEVPATGTTVALDLRARPQTVHVGDTLELSLADGAQGIAPEYRYGWDDPVIDGAAVRFVDRTVRRPPDDVDGGSNRNVFRLQAIAEGAATITIPVRNPGDEAGQDDVVVKVKVVAAP